MSSTVYRPPRGRRLHLVEPQIVHDAERRLVPGPVPVPLRAANVDEFMVLKRGAAG